MTDRPRVASLFQSTSEVEPNRALEYWRDTALTLTGVVSTGPGTRESFSASRLVAGTANGTLLHTRSTPIEVERTAHHVRRTVLDNVTIALFLRGSGYSEQQGRGTPMQPRDISLITTDRPYRVGAFEDYEEIRLIVPRAVFRRHVGEPEALTGMRFARGALNTLLADYLQSYAGLVARMSQTEADVAVEGALHLLRGLVDLPQGDVSTEALRALAQVQIERHLHDPSLGPETLYRALGVSRSSLYAAFAEGGGVAAAIRDARLDRAHRRLSMPAHDAESIATIARQCGFVHASSFGHAFRRRFGLAARDVRALRGEA